MLTDKQIYYVNKARKDNTVDPSWSDEKVAQVLAGRAAKAAMQKRLERRAAAVRAGRHCETCSCKPTTE